MFVATSWDQQLQHDADGTKVLLHLVVVECYLGGGFKYFFIFIPTWGNDPI